MELVYLDFLSWLWITIVAVVASLIWWYLLKIRAAAGYWVQLIFAWLGAWLGTPVFGNWGFWIGPAKGAEGGNVCFIPAAFGALAGMMLCAKFKPEEKEG